MNPIRIWDYADAPEVYKNFAYYVDGYYILIYIPRAHVTQDTLAYSAVQRILYGGYCFEYHIVPGGFIALAEK